MKGTKDLIKVVNTFRTVVYEVSFFVQVTLYIRIFQFRINKTKTTYNMNIS